MGLPTEQRERRDEVTQGVKRWILKNAFMLVFLAGVLFGAAGRLDWTMGWVLFTLYVATSVAQAMLLIPTTPELIAERSGYQEGTQSWDAVIGGVAASILPMATWILGGLDERFGWSPTFPVAVQIAAILVFLLGWGLILWAMASNAFFSATVRIQEDRDQEVVTGGPYEYIRHPGYVGAMVFQIAQAVILGSLWALIPAGLSALFYVARTVLEEKVLREELEGYEAYTRRVRYRLLPGVW